MMEEPGVRFNYNSGATEVVAYVFHRATGIDVEEYAARHLFAPLGITRWFWKRSSSGLVDTEGGLYLEARDLAKIAYLFLHNREWDGKQMVVVVNGWNILPDRPALPFRRMLSRLAAAAQLAVDGERTP
jgi:CubicO group peptidase (beta-lactamase class C family)